MNKKDYYGAIWDANHDFMSHLAPGSKSFINPENMSELHDFFAMMFSYPV
jgi:hypothetical protein